MTTSLNADKCLKKLKFLLYIFGVWYPKDQKIGYFIYSTVYLFICPGLTNIFMFIYLLKLDDQKDLTYGLYMFLTQFCGLIKFMFFLVNNENFQKLLERAKHFQLESEFEEKLLRQRIQFFYKVAIFYFVMAMTAIHTTEIMAIFAETVKLPFSAWYPYLDWEHNRRDYWIAVAYQHISITSASLLIITIDVLFSLLVFIVNIEIELIGLRMSKIGHFYDKCLKSELLAFEIKDFDILKKNIIFHREAIAFKCSLEQCFNWPFFVQIVASGIVISSIINEVARVSMILKSESYSFVTCRK